MAAPVHVRHTEHAFPQYRSLNLTTRGFNGTVVDKRAIIPEGKFITRVLTRHTVWCVD